MNLIRTILTAPWMIDEPTASAAMPIVYRLMKGDNVKFDQVDRKPYAFSASAMRKVSYGRFDNAPAGSVAVYPIIGAITKYDQFCGPMGTERLMMMMSRADEMKNIAGHLLEIDSGGGEGTNIETVARFIRYEIKKPVVAWFNGVNASAAYYISAATDEIYAGEDTDVVGSIGVMISFADMRPFFEEQGIRIHEIYADQSTLKNLDFKEALEGKYEKLREGLLNPYASRFISTVQEMRPNLKEKDAYKGAVYTADKAVEIGMIDGIRTFEQAVDRVLELGRITNPQQNSLEMNRINTVLGYELELSDGGVFLREDELQRIDRHLVSAGYEAVEEGAVTRLQENIQTIEASLKEMTDNVQALSERITNLESQMVEHARQIDEIGAQPGDVPTKAFSAADPAGMTPPDALDEFENTIRAAAESGGGIIVTK